MPIGLATPRAAPGRPHAGYDNRTNTSAANGLGMVRGTSAGDRLDLRVPFRLPDPILGSIPDPTSNLLGLKGGGGGAYGCGVLVRSLCTSFGPRSHRSPRSLGPIRGSHLGNIGSQWCRFSVGEQYQGDMALFP